MARGAARNRSGYLGWHACRYGLFIHECGGRRDDCRQRGGGIPDLQRKAFPQDCKRICRHPDSWGHGSLG